MAAGIGCTLAREGPRLGKEVGVRGRDQTQGRDQSTAHKRAPPRRQGHSDRSFQDALGFGMLQRPGTAGADGRRNKAVHDLYIRIQRL